MSDILARIVDKKRARVAAQKKVAPLSQVRRLGESARPRPGFPAALQDRQRIHIVAEVKKASPSAGLLRPVFDPVAIARAYAESGAAAISVLTEQDFFQGDAEHLKSISEQVNLPILRKDFIIDEYQMYEAKGLGASAILLIVALLDRKTLGGFLELAAALDLAALVEAHTGDEVAVAVDAGAEIIGINNRDLRTFQVTLATSLELARRIPAGLIKISESGIRTGGDLAQLREAGFDAVLVGEQFMRAPDPGAALRELAGGGEYD